MQESYRPVIAGKRCFECGECGHTWDEQTRDIDSPSGVDCPECGDWVTPLMGLPDPTQDAERRKPMIPWILTSCAIDST